MSAGIRSGGPAVAAWAVGGDKVEVLEVLHGAAPYEEVEKRLNSFLASEKSGEAR